MRKYRTAIVTSGLLFATACYSPTTETPTEIQGGALRGHLEGHVRFLADDALEGREAGRRGYDIAASYVASRFRMYGLAPGGANQSYFQLVPMIEVRKSAPDAGSLTFSGLSGGSSKLNEPDHFVFGSNLKTHTKVEAPVVFVGYGFASPDHGRDDFEGLDLDGKIALVLRGAPHYLNSEERAHFGASTLQRLSERGAIGAILVSTPTTEKTIPFERLMGFLHGRSFMSWLAPDDKPFSRSPNIQAMAIISMDGAEQLFGSAGFDWQEIAAAAESELGQVAGFDMGIDARIEVESWQRKVTSPNVVGILPGADPDLADEYVVLMAHLDHDGVKPTELPDDDEIYNGAMDNAVGIAVLLETARQLAEATPRRSVIFLAVTAEEKGMVGSDYFAENPTVPAEALVAVVNQDMPIVTYDFQDVVAYGAERSTLYPVVEEAVARAGLVLSPDPIPDEGIFTRSDQYSFAKRGIPGISLKPGFANGGEAAQKQFRSTHYHRASDEVELIDFESLRRFAEIKFEIASGIANMENRPVWRSGDFFGRIFDGPMEASVDPVENRNPAD